MNLFDFTQVILKVVHLLAQSCLANHLGLQRIVPMSQEPELKTCWELQDTILKKLQKLVWNMQSLSGRLLTSKPSSHLLYLSSKLSSLALHHKTYCIQMQYMANKTNVICSYSQFIYFLRISYAMWATWRWLHVPSMHVWILFRFPSFLPWLW